MQFFKKIKDVLSTLGERESSLTDEELVEQFVKTGDHEAYYEIWQRHGGYVYNLAYRITSDHHSAEEVSQEVMMQLIQKLDTFKGQSKFSSWLYRVTANASYSFLRQRKKYEKEVGLESYAPYDDNGTLMGKIMPKAWSDRPDSFLFGKESMEIIERAIGELPDSYRVVFVLRDVEGFTNVEVAETLEISVPAVKTRLHRARLALRDKISDYFMEWDKEKK